MTTETPNVEPEAKYLHIDSTATERLSQLHAAYAGAKAEADESAARLKVITDGIKLELQQLAPDEQHIALTGSDGPPLQMAYTESWRVDAKKLKREDPETYVRYATKGGSWRLAVAKGGETE